MYDFAHQYLLSWNLKLRIYCFEDYGQWFMILPTRFYYLEDWREECMTLSTSVFYLEIYGEGFMISH